MKKLISAVTSLCMAASMVSVVAPTAVGAADATKTFSIKTYAEAGSQFDTAGDKVTITKDMLAAGDVKIPCAVYYSEATADSNTLGVQLTVDSKDISFEAYAPDADYFASPKSFTMADGSSFSTSQYLAWVGTYDDFAEMYMPDGLTQVACAESQSMAGTDNYFIGYGWTKPTSNPPRDYVWCGAKSDDHPLFVFDVTIPSSIAAGTYTIDYCDYNTDTSGENNNPSCMVEVTGGRYTTGQGNLKLNTMTIVVEGDSQPGGDDTTTVTTTTTTKAPDVTTTTTVSTPADTDGDIIVDFGKYDATPGQTVKVSIKIDPKGNVVGGGDVNFSVQSPLVLTNIVATSKAYGAGVSFNLDELAANFTSVGSDGEGKLAEAGSELFLIGVKVPDDCPTGDYTVSFGSQYQFVRDGSGYTYKTGVIPGVIHVENPNSDGTTTTTEAEGTTTTTTTTTATTTKAPDVTTTTTTAPPVSGDKLTPTWGDVNLDKVVNVADVVLLNRYLDNTLPLEDQAKVNADVDGAQDVNGGPVDPNGVQLTAADSEAIIKSIVNLVTLPIK